MKIFVLADLFQKYQKVKDKNVNLLTTEQQKRQQHEKCQKESLSLRVFNSVCGASVEKPCVEAKNG